MYALVRAKTAPPLAGAPAGLEGASPPRAVDAGAGLWLVVADAPLERYGTSPIERGLQDLDWVSACAVAHEAVVEFVAHGEAPAIPMKLFTLFASDARAVEDLARRRRALDRAFDRVAGCDEYGVRVAFDPVRAARDAAQKARAAAPPTGTGFLLAKKQQRDATQELGERARGEVEALHARLERLARAARRRPPGRAEQAARMLLDAAFLVQREGARRFADAARAEAERLAPSGYDVTLTGPWPAYNFVAEPGA